jgi:uncharacterized membrane protein
LALIFPLQTSRFHADDLGWGITAGVSVACGFGFFYTALGCSRMAMVSPISAVVGVSVPVIVGYFTGAHTEILTSAGIVLAFLAITLVPESIEGHCWMPRDRGVSLAVMGGVGFGMFFLSLARTHHDAGVWPLIASRSVAVVMMTLWARSCRVSFRPSLNTVWMIVLTGFLDVCGNVFFLLAVGHGSLPVVAVLSGLYPVTTIFFACVVLRERLTRTQWAGAACAACGIALIVV